MKNKRAISLIVLVITIIVMAILAVTVVVTLSNTNIIKQANDAVEKSEKSNVIEAINLDVMAKKVSNLGNISENEILEILEKYGTLSDAEKLSDKVLKVKNGKTTIPVSEILREISSENSNRTFSIIGDSYSTFKGYTYPESNMQWYPTNDSTTQGYNKGNVINVEETWWHIFAESSGFKLEQNNSYSGSAISYDGYGDGTSDGKASSFCKRVESIPDSDLIVIFGGTNDYFIGVSQGEYKYSDWTETDKETFRPALAYLLNYIKTNHPNSQIIFVLNTELSQEFNLSIETICNKYDVDLLKLSNIEKLNSHPTIEGMKSIALQLLNFLNISRDTLASKVKIGDYVSYLPDVATVDSIISDLSKYSGNALNTTSTISQEIATLKWRVLDVEDGKVRLISATPTSSKVALSKSDGYNNIVYLLDSICRKLYNKNGYADKVQNLKIEDIEKYMITKPVYDNVRTYSPDSTYYPTILRQEKDQVIGDDTETKNKIGLSEQLEPVEQGKTAKTTSWSLKNKYWKQQMTVSSFESGYYNLFIADEQNNNYQTYYLSSRCPGIFDTDAYFAGRYVHAGAVDAATFYDTYDGEYYEYSLAFRPVVTLKSSVFVKNGTGALDSPYDITLSK